MSSATQVTAARPTISYLSLLIFYLPLGFAGLLMTLDQPVVNSVLTRFPNPDTSVAALRVAFSLALVYEASHISMIDVSTALSFDLRVFRLLRRFYIIMAAVLLVGATLFVFSPAYNFVVREVMNIPPGAASAAWAGLVVFLLWPIPIGWRRLYQGVLIRHGHSKPVGAGGLVRIISLAAALIFFGWFGTNVMWIEPTAIGVLAMLVSVTAEAVAVQRWTDRILREIPESVPGKAEPTYRDVWHFVFPLAGTSIMNTLVQPVLTAGIATAAIAWASPGGSVVAVAAYSLAWSAIFFVFGPTFSFTQASIAWHSSPDGDTRHRGPRLIVGVGLGLSALLALVAFTPVAYWFISVVLDAPAETAVMAVTVVRCLVPLPLLNSISFMLRGKLIARHRPKAVRRAQLVDLAAVFLIVVLFTLPSLSVLFAGVSAAPLAAIAYDLMLCVDISVLLLSLRRYGGPSIMSSGVAGGVSP